MYPNELAQIPVQGNLISVVFHNLSTGLALTLQKAIAKNQDAMLDALSFTWSLSVKRQNDPYSTAAEVRYWP